MSVIILSQLTVSGVNVEEVKFTLFSMLVSSIITSTMGGGSFLTPIINTTGSIYHMV